MEAWRRFTLGPLGAVAVLLLAGLATYKATQNEDRRARFRQRDQEVRTAVALGRQVDNHVRQAWRDNMSLADFQKQFGEVTALARVTEPRLAGMTHLFHHAASQRTFYLRFEDGRLMGSTSHHGSGDVRTTVVLKTPAFLFGEAIRKGVLTFSLLGWLVMLVVGVLVRRIRNAVAWMLVVLAGFCGLSWLLAPTYAVTWQGMTSNDNLVLAVIILFMSLGFWPFFSARQIRQQEPRLVA